MRRDVLLVSEMIDAAVHASELASGVGVAPVRAGSGTVPAPGPAAPTLRD